MLLNFLRISFCALGIIATTLTPAWSAERKRSRANRPRVDLVVDTIGNTFVDTIHFWQR